MIGTGEASPTKLWDRFMLSLGTSTASSTYIDVSDIAAGIPLASETTSGLHFARPQASVGIVLFPVFQSLTVLLLEADASVPFGLKATEPLWLLGVCKHCPIATPYVKTLGDTICSTPLSSLL